MKFFVRNSLPPITILQQAIAGLAEQLRTDFRGRQDVALVEQKPHAEGRSLLMILGPAGK